MGKEVTSKLEVEAADLLLDSALLLVVDMLDEVEL